MSILAKSRAGCSAAALAVLLSAGAGHARDDVSVVVGTGVSAGTNPYLSIGSDTEALSAYLDVAPYWAMDDEVSTVVLRGSARVERFSNIASTNTSALASLAVTRRLSDTLSLRGGADFKTDRSSAQDILSGRVNGGDPVPGAGPPINDVSFVGGRSRTMTMTARVGATFSLTDQSSIDGDLSVGSYRYRDSSLADYRFASQRLGYASILTERTTLTVNLDLQEVDYLGRDSGDSLITTPLLGLTRELSETTKASFAAGVSLSRLRQLDGSYKRATGLALRGRLCNETVRGRICADLDRSSQPTALGEVRLVTSLAASASMRLNQRDSLLITASGSRTSESGGISRGQSATFAGASAELSRQVSPRVALFGSLAYADIFDAGIARRASLQVRVGAQYRFGATQ